MTSEGVIGLNRVDHPPILSDLSLDAPVRPYAPVSKRVLLDEPGRRGVSPPPPIMLLTVLVHAVLLNFLEMEIPPILQETVIGGQEAFLKAPVNQTRLEVI